MKQSRIIVLVLITWFAVGPRPGLAAPDQYDDSQSHPLRVAAYLLHPAALLVEWVVFRPLHYLVSVTETQEKIFGHRPHPPVLADPYPPRDYGLSPTEPVRPSPPPPAAISQKPVREVVKVIEVPTERIVVKEVPKIVEVEKFVFPGVAFQFDSADLTEWGKGSIYLAAAKLKEKSEITVVVEGHTDEIGTPEYNRALGLRRAERVMTELAALGIDSSRISAATHGEQKPLIDQATAWARAVNRRVEFQVKGQ